MFDSFLVLWAILSLVPGHPGSVRGRLSPPAWISSWTNQWLATSTIFEWNDTLSQHIFQRKQIVGWKSCSWVSVPVPRLENLSGYRRWPVQTPYTPLLGILARVTLLVSISTLKCPPVQVASPVCSSSILPQSDPSCSISTCPSSQQYQLHLLFPERFMCVSLPSLSPFSLLCISGSVSHSMIILYNNYPLISVYLLYLSI